MKKCIFLVAFIFLTNLAYSQSITTDNYLEGWPAEKTPLEIGNRLAAKFLLSGYTRWGRDPGDRPIAQMTYPDICTWTGGLWFAVSAKDTILFNRFEEKYNLLIKNEKHLLPPPNHVDNNVFGAIPFEMCLQKKKTEYLKMGLHYADSQWILPENATADQKAWADKGYSWQTRLWIDDMFMITAVQSQAYRATGDRKYIDRTAKEMVLYLNELQLQNGLFYHAPEAHFCWGRGNGWMTVGMTEILRALPVDNPDRKQIMEGYLKMMSGLLRHQAEDGMWRQIVDDNESWKETSGTAMFTYAMITGVKNGWLDSEIYGNAARKAWISLTGYLNENDEMTEVCAGTVIKNEREHYMTRPRFNGDLHGHAPMIWCAAALLR